MVSSTQPGHLNVVPRRRGTVWEVGAPKERRCSALLCSAQIWANGLPDLCARVCREGAAIRHAIPLGAAAIPNLPVFAAPITANAVKANYGLVMPKSAGLTLAAPSSNRVQAKLLSRASKTALDAAPVLPESR